MTLRDGGLVFHQFLGREELTTKDRNTSMIKTWCNVCLVVFLMLLAGGGCGGNKAYVAPEGDNASTLVLINDIFDAGFYVEIDKKDAGFLQKERSVQVKPGKHTIKIYNSETTVAEEAITTKHKFEITVEVGEGETETITLAWDHPDYSKDVHNAAKSIRPDKKENKPRRGMTMPQ